MHITTVILLWIFHLISLILLICQRSLFNVFFIFFIKNAFLTFFILGVNVFYIYCSRLLYFFLSLFRLNVRHDILYSLLTDTGQRLSPSNSFQSISQILTAIIRPFMIS